MRALHVPLLTAAALLLACALADPSSAADCPPIAGDLAPGTLDLGTDPPTFLAMGDGTVSTRSYGC